jgi:hypothetical protein
MLIHNLDRQNASLLLIPLGDEGPQFLPIQKMRKGNPAIRKNRNVDGFLKKRRNVHFFHLGSRRLPENRSAPESPDNKSFTMMHEI